MVSRRLYTVNALFLSDIIACAVALLVVSSIQSLLHFFQAYQLNEPITFNLILRHLEASKGTLPSFSDQPLVRNKILDMLGIAQARSLRGMSAFVSSFSGLRVGRALPVPAVCTRQQHATTRMQTDGSGSIDFSKVKNMSTVGENLAGLVFTPEREEPSALDTRCNVGYDSEEEDAVNRHINVEFTAMYAYHALWAYFNRDTVALPGFAKYFNDQSLEERSHAHEFMEYQNKRGGKVELMPIAVPEMAFAMNDGTSDAVYAMDLALQLEKFVYHKLKDLQKIADSKNDSQMSDFIDNYLAHQVDAIKEVADYVAQLKRVGTGHGVYHIDRVLLEA